MKAGKVSFSKGPDQQTVAHPGNGISFKAKKKGAVEPQEDVEEI